MNYLDVVVFSDFRLPGGTNHSTAQELAIHRANGIATGLVQINSRLSSRPLAWNQTITDQIHPGIIEPLKHGQPTSAALALIRHPIAAEALPDLSKTLKVDAAIIVVNQPATKPDGSTEYDVSQINHTVRDNLGVNPIWAPIGPVVRKSLEQLDYNINLAAEDWINVFARPSTPIARREFNRSKPTIGRHSRPQAAKWPDNESDILAAYPDTCEYTITILGGAKPAFEILGYQPPNWVVHEFGSLPPEQFLQSVDFWVYFHHPLWSEAYGRAIMEALWAGCVVILPRRFEETYGNSAIYCSPDEVRSIIKQYQDGVRDYHTQSEIGQRFARQHSSQLHVDRMQPFIKRKNSDHSSGRLSTTSFIPQELKVNNRRQTLKAALNPTAKPRRYYADKRPRALFITSNGAGMGHLTRLLGLARYASSFLDPVFFSMSKGVEVVGTAGFAYEYVPFNSAMQTKSTLWHRYFADRLRAAIKYYKAKIIVFDGTWPYRGLIEVFSEISAPKIWIRRGMWKPHITPEQLQKANYFDLVIEPGEFASEFDIGATSQVDNACLVNPMTVLSGEDLLSREDALDELGLNQTDQNYALVTLGAGNINDISGVLTKTLTAIAHQTNLTPVVTKAPIAEATVSSGSLRVLNTFPLAKYTRAFDFAVSAAGYNSFAEWIVGHLPTLWIPNLETMTDNQDARARWAEHAGIGLQAQGDDQAEIERKIETLSDPHTRARMVRRMKLYTCTNGSAEASDLIEAAWQSFEESGGTANGKR